MREIVLDTETTGLDPDTGDRIVELGAVELVNHMPTGRSLPRATSIPQRDVPAEAVAVHGLTTAFLADKPVFRAVAAEFVAFLGDARLVIHNAAFDMKFLNAELGWAGHRGLPWAPRRRHAGARRAAASPARRTPSTRSAAASASTTPAATKHGALLNSELLAEVYLELIGGRQPDLILTVVAAGGTGSGAAWIPPPRPRPLPPRLTAAEAAAHAAFVAELGEQALWTRLA